MPAKPKLPGPQTDSRARAYCSPEEEELHRKREDLERLQADLAEAELELATLRSGLVNFERRYLQVVGCRYAQLDQIEAQIAAAAARCNPQDSSARQKADAAQARARESAEAMGDVGPETTARRFEPTEELNTLYRQVAKELHPDLTTDEAERARRQQAMAELNRAFEECDVERIKQILDRWRSSPEQVRGDDTAAQLVRTIREIAQARKRLAAIKTEIEELLQGELASLKKQVEEAAARGQDLLAEIAGRLDAQIDQTRTRLKEVSKVGQRR
ncbi:MAG: molecular chaperone DnaJ [Planctomycetia bacterium]|nr:molecular chaperone DnaJ [Planctomycetia bacterium]